MPSAQKIEKVEALKRRINSAEALLFADFRGLSVSDATELRSSLRDSGARFSIVKNSLMRRAAGDSGVEGIIEFVEGPTGVAFVERDPVLAAKRLVEASKKYPALVLRGAFVEGRLLSGEEARSLASLESREAMLSKVAGLAKGEMARAASVLKTLQASFLSAVDALQGKRGADETPAAEDEKPQQETVNDEEAEASEGGDE